MIAGNIHLEKRDPFKIKYKTNIKAILGRVVKLFS